MVCGSFQPGALYAWSLHALPVHVQVLFWCSGFLPQTCQRATICAPHFPTDCLSKFEVRLSVVLSEVIQAFSVPENAARMEEARESACNDMGKMLQLVLPVATQIQQEVIKAYGFNNEGEGVLKFARLVKMYETQDPEIAAMSAKLKSLLLPPLSTPPIGGTIPAS
ncbi:hypothetical protein ILYODFUR_024048 [Ilyodon furcidens]|uniref:Protein C10 n=3 Tax=Goodeidae TaxID=28758 RepID=A0ABV0TAN1_9TELE